MAMRFFWKIFVEGFFEKWRVFSCVEWFFLGERSVPFFGGNFCWANVKSGVGVFLVEDGMFRGG